MPDKKTWTCARVKRWVRDYYAVNEEPVPFSRFSRRWAREIYCRWGYDWDAAVDEIVRRADVHLVFQRVGTRVLFPLDAWNALPLELKDAYSLGRDSRSRYRRFEPTGIELQKLRTTSQPARLQAPTPTALPFFSARKRPSD